MSRIYSIFLKGLLTLLPIMLTIYLLAWVANQAERALGEPLRAWFPTVFGFPGSGFLVGVVLILIVGLMVNSYLTQQFVEWFETKMDNLPVIRSIYSPIRDVTNLFAKGTGTSTQRVVMVKLDEHGLEVMGLITREQFADLPNDTVPAGNVTVFVPFSYGMGGFTVLVPKARVRETSLPAERAMQLAITGWIKASKHEPDNRHV